MKVIERPETTTLVVEELYHLVKDAKEMKNIMAGVDANDIFKIRISMNPQTFQPMLFFAIKKEGKPFSDWMKYVAPLELTVPNA